MLLTSDSLLLQEAENALETSQLYAVMAEHFHQLHNRFGLSDVAAPRHGSALLREKISLLLVRYLDLQQHLAADNFEEARVDSLALLPLQKNESSELRTTGFEQANSLADLLRAAKELADIRTAFYPFSQTLAQVVKTFGSSDNTPLYNQFCPMAFGNTGATWLSPTEEINNPYFGAMMLRCGEVRQQITL